VEARSLADALARWRRDGNAEAALAHLHEHDRRFPGGALSVESKVARAEILLTVGRRPEALTTLDTLELRRLPRARELETIRGELRIQAGRCADARADFAHVLQGAPRGRASDDFDARASRALTKCP
jgi:predicted Zn-dependent protease